MTRDPCNVLNYVRTMDHGSWYMCLVYVLCICGDGLVVGPSLFALFDEAIDDVVDDVVWDDA